MPSSHIHATASTVPRLSLPAGAFSRSDARYAYDVDRDPPAIEPIEHRIRLDFMAGGPIRRDQLLGKYNPYTSGPGEQDPWRRSGKPRPQGLRYAETSCRRTLEEETRFYQHVDDESVLEQAPEFLAHQISGCRDTPDPETALREERNRRKNWYTTVIPWKNLYHVLKRSTYGSLVKTTIGASPDGDSLIKENPFVGMVLVDDDVDPDEFADDHDLPTESVFREGTFTSDTNDTAPSPSDYGIGLPAPLLVGEYASGSQYPFIPWSDAVVCACPYKHDRPWRVLCKHELLAAIVAGSRDSIFLPVTRGIEVPYRARRFVSPTVASRYKPRE